MNLVYKDGKGNNEAVVYEGESANGLNHTIRWNDRPKLLVSDSNLEHLHQMSLSNPPQTPLDYCREVGKGLTKEEAKRLSGPRTLIKNNLLTHNVINTKDSWGITSDMWHFANKIHIHAWGQHWNAEKHLIWCIKKLAKAPDLSKTNNQLNYLFNMTLISDHLPIWFK